MQILGIEFAPLNVSLERRLQTLAAAGWFTVFAFGGFFGVGLAAYLVIFTRLWWITLIYLLWVYFIDFEKAETGGRPNKWVKSWKWWKYLNDYFPAKLERLPCVELDPKRNYLFCCFPHGILSAGTFNTFSGAYSEFSNIFPHHKVATVILSQHFNKPFFRELALSLGAIASSAKSINSVLKDQNGGRGCAIVVGGVAESYYAKPGQYILVLKNRKGFVKVALKNGSPLVPVFTFGETDLYNQIDAKSNTKFHQFQEALRKIIGMAPIIPIGRGFFQYSFGLVPRRKPITTIIGKPIEVQKNENPSNEEIDELHSRFIEELKTMFEEQKNNYLENAEKINLVIT